MPDKAQSKTVAKPKLPSANRVKKIFKQTAKHRGDVYRAVRGVFQPSASSTTLRLS